MARKFDHLQQKLSQSPANGIVSDILIGHLADFLSDGERGYWVREFLERTCFDNQLQSFLLVWR